MNGKASRTFTSWISTWRPCDNVSLFWDKHLFVSCNKQNSFICFRSRSASCGCSNPSTSFTKFQIKINKLQLHHPFYKFYRVLNSSFPKSLPLDPPSLVLKDSGFKQNTKHKRTHPVFILHKQWIQIIWVQSNKWLQLVWHKQGYVKGWET